VGFTAEPMWELHKNCNRIVMAPNRTQLDAAISLPG
jgi:hypothetical protein